MSSPQDETHRRARALLREGGGAYYRFADAHLVRRTGGAALALVTLTVLGLLPFEAPVRAVSAPVGWGVGALLVAAGAFATALLLTDDGRISPQATLPIAFGAVLGLGLLRHLAGGTSPYDELSVLVIVWASATHPPGRVAAVVGLALGGGGVSVLAAPTQSGVEETAVHLVIWSCLAGLALAWTAAVRAQRALMHEGESQAHALARVDALTGLGNRRAFDEALAGELARAARNGRPLSLVVGDLDQFKAINDRHGHLAGDACLRQVAAVVTDTVRRPDACFRWGGDEFALLLADTDLDGARLVGTRVAAAIEATCRSPSGRPLSVGLGVATNDLGDTPDTLLARADAALLLAKLPA
jgi:diguanylate cyclase (GGDEF)-like protein